ncbi:MAG: type II toxin-antitoxin system RelE/ParE family toxin [Candidatus Dormibacteraeota bacterium]|uniref:Type II toxin-antitoxin system RelE/ParE family toxin n=1 Tax=Candidatus Amunia macphersoniae TaxID=3127014 RepID=A0A934KHE7_9BACT|nr:type II toxin-antitoxin system RelE/ParE family toxin [Candidatus Dormibacteraeota bacterium]
MTETRRQWRDYRTAGGQRPVHKFIAGLSVADAVAVAAAMKDVRAEGPSAARHLRGDIYEVRADAEHATYRVLFSAEGRWSHVLLALEAFSKKSPATPPRLIVLAEKRLRDWRSRAQHPGNL